MRFALQVSMRRLWFPLLLGVVGVAILCALGAWQVRRLAWKEAALAEIEARIAAEPVVLPVAPDPAADRYLPVTVTGTLGGEEALVLTAVPEVGPAYRVVSALTTGDRRVLVDLGYVPEGDRAAPRMAEGVTVMGNLHWPDEVDGWTPSPDEGAGLWFARDVPAMAAALGTEPVMVVARVVEGADLGVTPLPVGTAGIPNDHLSYAVTWFGLAAVWAAMSVALMRRNARTPA